MKKELRWRIIYGYNPNDYLAIGEEYIEKAKYAFYTGKIFNHPQKIIKGSEIKRIEPDIRYYTGWYDTYEPKEAEDFKQIHRDVPMREIEERSLTADKRVRYVIEHKKPALLANPEQILLA